MLACVLSLATVASVRAESASGTVEVPTAGSPAPGRVLARAGAAFDGIAGRVVDLTRRIPDGRPYTLVKHAGIEPVDLDVYFYADLWGERGEGVPCRPTGPSGGPPAPDGHGGETGQVWCGDANGDGKINVADQARWAVVFLSSGAHARFTLSW